MLIEAPELTPPILPEFQSEEIVDVKGVKGVVTSVEWHEIENSYQYTIYPLDFAGYLFVYEKDVLHIVWPLCDPKWATKPYQSII